MCLARHMLFPPLGKLGAAMLARNNPGSAKKALAFRGCEMRFLHSASMQVGGLFLEQPTPPNQGIQEGFKEYFWKVFLDQGLVIGPVSNGLEPTLGKPGPNPNPKP